MKFARGERHMQGAYVNIDDFASRVRKSLNWNEAKKTMIVCLESRCVWVVLFFRFVCREWGFTSSSLERFI